MNFALVKLSDLSVVRFVTKDDLLNAAKDLKGQCIALRYVDLPEVRSWVEMEMRVW